MTEIVSANAWQRYEGRQLVAEGELPWGFLPVVHIQNIAQPYCYEGLSDVEPLIPLQDELNTRLSDRGNRITFQSSGAVFLGAKSFVSVSPGKMFILRNQFLAKRKAVFHIFQNQPIAHKVGQLD